MPDVLASLSLSLSLCPSVVTHLYLIYEQENNINVYILFFLVSFECSRRQTVVTRYVHHNDHVDARMPLSSLFLAIKYLKCWLLFVYDLIIRNIYAMSYCPIHTDEKLTLPHFNDLCRTYSICSVCCQPATKWYLIKWVMRSMQESISTQIIPGEGNAFVFHEWNINAFDLFWSN